MRKRAPDYAPLWQADYDGEWHLSDLEETICIRGWLRRLDIRHASGNGTSHPIAIVNERYGTCFRKRRDALAFMDVKVEEAKQAARERADQYRRVELL